METYWLMSENDEFVSVNPGDAGSVYGLSGGAGPQAAEQEWSAGTDAFRDRVMLVRGELHNAVIYRAEVLISVPRTS